MNPNMNPEQSQDLTAEEAKASLGMATFLQDQLMPQQAPEAQQTQEMGQEQPEQPQNEQQADPRLDQLEGQFMQFKEDINQTINDRFTQLSDQIKQALSEDEPES